MKIYIIYSNLYGDVRKIAYKTKKEAEKAIFDNPGNAKEEIFEVNIDL